MAALLAAPPPEDVELARHQAALHALVVEAGEKMEEQRLPSGGRPRSASMAVGRLSMLGKMDSNFVCASHRPVVAGLENNECFE